MKILLKARLLFGLAALMAASAGCAIFQSPNDSALPFYPPTGLNYTKTEAVYTINEIIEPNFASFFGTVNSFSIDPDLPDGLSMDSKTGIIIGTPTAFSAETEYKITAKGENNMTTALTITIEINTGDAVALNWVTQPTDRTGGEQFAADLEVEIVDGTATRVTDGTYNVTLTIDTNPGPGTLSGTVTVASVSGLATFAGLSVDKIGAGYTLLAASSGLTSATSDPFNVTLGPAAQLGFIVEPHDTDFNMAIENPSIEVEIQDAGGNPVTAASATVNIAIEDNPTGAILTGTTAVPTVSGVSTFDDLVLDKVGTDYTLSANAFGLTSGISDTFDIVDDFELHLTQTNPVIKGQCSGAFSVASVGVNRVTKPATTDLIVNLTDVGSGNFYTDSACALAPVTTVTISNTESSVLFYYENATEEVTSIQAEFNGNTSLLTFGVAENIPGQLGVDHSCFLANDLDLFCSGKGSNYRLGTGATANQQLPVPATGGANTIAVAAGWAQTCKLDSSNSVSCVGSNDSGEIGDGTTGTATGFTSVLGSNNAIMLSGHFESQCAVQVDGTIECWGVGNYGQMGNGTTNTINSTPLPVNGIDDAVSVAAARYHVCALLRDGRVKCWGRNNYGQLGDGTTTDSSTPLLVPNLYDAIQIVVGVYHSCALFTDGTVECWGYNGYGQLGNGGTTDSLTPTSSPGFTTTMQIAGGLYTTCGLAANQTIQCVGQGQSGQIGNGDIDYKILSPVTVSGIGNALMIASGYKSFAAGVSTGDIKYWGENHFGEAGDGTLASVVSPTPAHSLGSVTDITVSSGSTGFLGHTCVSRTNGTVDCWGIGDYGRLGNGSSNDQVNPVDLSGGLNSLVQVSAGRYHTCALKSDTDEVYCWGDDGYGQLGNNGATTDSSTPVLTTTLTDPIQISTGFYSSCALELLGTAMCWGRNDYGELGNGLTTAATEPVPYESGLDTINEIQIGQHYSCVRRDNDDVYCLGRNQYGQLGNNSTTDSLTPVAVNLGGNPALSIAVGTYHTCAVVDELPGPVKKVYCWGYNNYGQLGNSSTTDSLVPVVATGLTDALKVFVSMHQSCAIVDDNPNPNKVYCWGYNAYGSLGDGSFSTSTAPVEITGAASAVDMAMGEYDTCAIKSDGTAHCWGLNGSGELGTGALGEETGNKPTPVDVDVSGF